MAPLWLCGSRLRAEGLEFLSDRMITETAVPGGVLRFFAPTPLLQDRAAAVLTKEPDMIRWIDRIGEDAVLWDVGANVGVFSLYAAARTNCRVLAFEPSAGNFFVLSRNIQLNRLDGRVTAYCIALSATTNLGVLNLASAAMGAAMSQYGKAGEMSRYWAGAGGNAVHGMVGFSVDDFIQRFDPPFPTHLKMDVDGLEQQILQGAAKALRDPRLRSAIVELSLTDVEERSSTMAFLEECGLQFVSQGETQGTETQKAANHLFERAPD